MFHSFAYAGGGLCLLFAQKPSESLNLRPEAYQKPASIEHWSLRSIQVKLIKIGAKVVHHTRQVIFQMAEVAISKELFEQILERIWALAPGVG